MKKEGFVVCGGNLFHHESASVLAEIICFTDGKRLCILCNNASEFVLLHKKMVNIFGNQFEIREKKALRSDCFELFFCIYGDAERMLIKIEKEITEEKSVSRFVQCGD